MPGRSSAWGQREDEINSLAQGGLAHIPKSLFFGLLFICMWVYECISFFLSFFFTISLFKWHIWLIVFGCTAFRHLGLGLSRLRPVESPRVRAWTWVPGSAGRVLTTGPLGKPCHFSTPNTLGLPHAPPSRILYPLSSWYTCPQFSFSFVDFVNYH